MTDTLTTVDKVTMLVSGGLITLGIVVMGVLEALIGNPSAVPVTNDAGEVVATTTFPVELRAYLVLLGLAVLFVYGLYKLATPIEPAAGAPSDAVAD